jgi:predicted dehydrogenase
MKKVLWLIGSGPMAIDYAKVLIDQKVDFVTIGRSERNATIFADKTGIKPIMGGLDSFLDSKPDIPQGVVVAVGVESLAETTLTLLDYGIKNILCEKPGGLNQEQINQVSDAANAHSATVLLAYNRRFYSSVEKAMQIIDEDGGVSSFHFEFTEWSHIISPLEKDLSIKHNWFMGNSTHVADLAFFLGGRPEEISCFTFGGVNWHPRSSVFAGAGRSVTGALFSYQANWEAPGRWAVEILTKKHRLYFKPMEKLHIQKIGSVVIEEVEIYDSLDKLFKPGLYKQTEAFLHMRHERFITIQDQLIMADFYNKIANYK